MNRKETTYFEILGRNDGGEVIVLGQVFEYEGGMKGAKGISFEIVSPEEVQERLDDFREYIREHWQYDASNDYTELSLDEWIEHNFEDDEDKIQYIYDDSYSRLHDAIRELFNVPEGAVIHCVSGGRMFPRALEGLEWLPGQQERFERIILDAEAR